MATPTPDPHAELQDALRRLEQMRPSGVSSETLQRLQEGVGTQYAELAEQARKLEIETNAALERSDPTALLRVKERAAWIRGDMEALEDQDRKLEDARQRRIVRDRMGEVLGSPQRLLMLETLVLTLITVVLGLLVYDNVAGEDETRPAWLSSWSIFYIDTCCCMIFMSEFLLRLFCAESKRFIWRNHWIDFVTSIPFPGEAQLVRFGRVARLARFARLLRLLRFLRLFFLLGRGLDKLQDVIDVKLMKRTLRWALAIMLLGALLIYQVEGVPENPETGEPNDVGTYPLALWWSYTTVVTGGFADLFNPQSPTGQILTAILVLMGMVLVGVFTATLTSLYVGEQSEEIERLQEDLVARLDELAKRLEGLEGD